MTQPLDDHAIQILSNEGAQCGVCGDQPGDRTCPDCEKCRADYMAALRAAGWAPSEERDAMAAEIRRLRAQVARVKRLHDNLAAETDLTSPDDPITRSAAAKRIATALDGWNPTGAPQCDVEFAGGGRCAKPAGHRPPGSDDPHVPDTAALPAAEETHVVADADNPTPLRWGLNDVMWGDDDTITVLLSGPNGEPYWLELDPERAAVLRQDLAGPGQCGARHYQYPDTVCTEPAGHYQRTVDPHAGPLVIDGRERGGAAWDEPAAVSAAARP